MDQVKVTWFLPEATADSNLGAPFGLVSVQTVELEPELLFELLEELDEEFEPELELWV